MNSEQDEFQVDFHESDTETELNKCPNCGDQFVTPTALKIHRMKCKVLQPTPPPPKSDPVETCPSPSSDNPNLPAAKENKENHEEVTKKPSPEKSTEPNEAADMSVIRAHPEVEKLVSDGGENKRLSGDSESSDQNPSGSNRVSRRQIVIPEELPDVPVVRDIPNNGQCGNVENNKRLSQSTAAAPLPVLSSSEDDDHEEVRLSLAQFFPSARKAKVYFVSSFSFFLGHFTFLNCLGWKTFWKF